MTARPTLTATRVGKSYRAYTSTWWRAAGWITGRPSHFSEHWVLRDVSFQLQPGQAVGVVGRNGAGKSTLLKLVAGTVTPTEGAVAACGRVSAILELGMGFNSEFSGRENATHSCGLLGYEPARIRELVPWIESFADIGAYFDQPVRTYSSGMTMRLAFGVATATRPDVLIVDEALSVGDATFQRKSFRRIEEFLAAGTSLLFVSHAMETIRAICDGAIWLDGGRVRMSGSAKAVTEAYEKASFPGAAAVEAPSVQRGYFDESLTGAIEQEYGNGGARISNVRILDVEGDRINAIPIGGSFSIDFDVEFTQACDSAHFGMLLKTTEGLAVYGMNTDNAGLRSSFAAGETVRVSFRLKNNLCPGVYFVNCGASHETPHGRGYLHRRVDVCALRVLASSSDENIVGLAHLEGAVQIRQLEAMQESG